MKDQQEQVVLGGVLAGGLGFRAFGGIVDGAGGLLSRQADALVVEVPLKGGEGEAQDLGAVAKSYAGDAAKWMAGLLARVWTGGLAVVNLVSLVVVTPVVAFYLLNDWDRIVARVDDLLPRDHAGVIREQVREMDQIISAFVRGVAGARTFTCLVTREPVSDHWELASVS